MTLLDFIIKISLNGQQATRELRRVTADAMKAKAALDATGASADKTSKRLKQIKVESSRANTEVKKLNQSTNDSLRRLSRSARAGGGFSIGGSGFSIAIAPFVSALAAAPPQLKIFAAAVAAAAASLSVLSKVQDAEAANVIAINPRNPDGTLRSQADIARIRQNQRDLAFDGPELNVRGRNVLRGRSVLQNTLDIGSLERANVEANAGTLAAFARFSMLAEGASEDDKAKAAAIAQKEAIRRNKSEGIDIGKAFDQELGKIIKLAGDTHRSVDEVIRAQPKAQALIEEAGLSSSQAFALQALTATVEPTARAAAQHLNAALIDMLAGADKKKVKDLEEQGVNIFDDDGKFLGLENFADELLEFEKVGGSMAGAIKSVFGEENVAPLLSFIQRKDEFGKLTEGFDTDATLAADNAAEAQADTISGKGQEIMAAWERLMLVIASMGFDIVFGWLADALILLINGLTTGLGFIAYFTRQLFDTINENVKFIVGLFNAGMKYLYDLLPDVAKKFIDKVSRPATTKRKGAAKADKAPTVVPNVPSIQPAQSVAQAKTALSTVSSQGAKAAAIASDIKAFASIATAQVNILQPLVKAAAAYQNSVVLSFLAARLGVEAQLLTMLATILRLAPQFNLAGVTLGSQFTAGLQAGFSTAGVVQPAGAYIDNRKYNIQGNGDSYLKKTANNIVAGDAARRQNRRNLPR